MVNSCCVAGCKNESYPGSCFSFHRFPKNENTKMKWKNVVPGKITKSSFVCSAHFKRDDFIPGYTRKKLKADAVPSIFSKDMQKMHYKREAPLERMLMPDAPPRKRHSKKESPERQTCILVETPVQPCVEFNPTEPVASTTVVLHSSESEESDGAEACPAGMSRLEFEPTDIKIEFVDEASQEYSEDRVYIVAVQEASQEYLGEGIEIGAEVAVPSSSCTDPLTNGSPDKNSSNVSQWLTEFQSDDDLEIDDLDIDPLHTVPFVNQPSLERDAASEPACDTDLTAFQAEVLQREDAANDAALRSIVPDDCCTFSWSKNRCDFQGQRETFTGTSGPTFDMTAQIRVIDIFDKMFDIDFIDLLCTETNRNAEQKLGLLRKQKKLPVHSRFNRWTPTNRDEMLTFLAIIILQGLYPLPDEESYFKFNGFGTMPYFAKIMSYNRFLLLKGFLHFVDNNNLQDKTRLGKIRPAIDYFNDKFSRLYMPSQDIAIDESLLKWYGRLSFSQKISSKAAQVGIKTYELCESSTGYLWKFFVYSGRDKSTEQTDNTAKDSIDSSYDDETNQRPMTNDISSDSLTTTEMRDRPTNATAMIVYDLIEPLLHRGHTVIMDNFYNSPLLLRSLKKQKTDCYGTLRLNREYVPESVKYLTKTELRQGEVVATYCADLSILVWRDANLVSMISTYHNLQIGIQDKYNRQTYKPNIVLDYNKSMGGVDRKDQFLSAQPLERVRNRIWYKKLFRRLYNAAIYNCFVIFSSFQRKHKISHRQFRIVLAEDLLKRHRKIDLTTEQRRLNVRSNTTGQVTTTVAKRNVRIKTQARPTVDSNHFPIRTGSKHTCCFVCPKKTRTIWKCEECDVNLCIEGCFKAYHKP